MFDSYDDLFTPSPRQVQTQSSTPSSSSRMERRPIDLSDDSDEDLFTPSQSKIQAPSSTPSFSFRMERRPIDLSDDSDEDLFTSRPRQIQTQNSTSSSSSRMQRTQKSLFDDSDGELSTPSPRQVQAQSSTPSASSRMEQRQKKLFDSDDELFAPSPRQVQTQSSTSSSSSRMQRRQRNLDDSDDDLFTLSPRRMPTHSSRSASLRPMVQPQRDVADDRASLSRQLWLAVFELNVDVVKQILANTDENNIPRADINYEREGKSLLMMAVDTWCTHDDERKLTIVQALLDIRDRNNNPVININATPKSESDFSNDSQTSSVFHILLQCFFYGKEELRMKIFEAILNVKDAQGRMLADLKQTEYLGTETTYDWRDFPKSNYLVMAANTFNIPLFKKLLSLCNSKGEKLFDINAGLFQMQTLLDKFMHEHMESGRRIFEKKQMHSVIISAGGLPFHRCSPRKVRQLIISGNNREVCIAANAISQATFVVIFLPNRLEENIVVSDNEQSIPSVLSNREKLVKLGITEIPEEFCDVLDNEIMDDPVHLIYNTKRETGVYDRKTLDKMNESPMSRRPLAEAIIETDSKLKEEIEAFVESQVKKAKLVPLESESSPNLPLQPQSGLGLFMH